MNKIRLGFLAVIIVIAASAITIYVQQQYWGNPTFVTFSATEAKQFIETEAGEGLLIMDVRPDYAYYRERIEGAINIPILRLREGIEMPKNKSCTILVYSNTGVTGQNASQILINNGFSKVYNIDGGIKAWISEGLPVIYPNVIESPDEEPNGDCGCK